MPPRLPSRSAARLLLTLALAAALAAGPTAVAQQAEWPVSPEERMQRYERHREMAEESMFGNLPWQFLGPTDVSGRMTDVAVVEPKGEHYTIYVAGASGGVWRTENEGVTWEPIFQEAASTSIGDVTLAPSDPDVIWVGTGEANIFRSSMAGAGVYKSTDRGETWTHMGLTGTHTIPRIVIHPENPDVVYVAASGHEWTDNPERGVYKSTDGGESWDKVLFVDEQTGAIDLVMDPRDPDVLYAATWQRVRKKWSDPRNEPGYSGSGIWRTEDGGTTWTPINDGLPGPEFRGRIGIDVARSAPDTLYAFVDNYEIARHPEEDETDAYGRPRAPVIRGATVYRTDDRGESWRRVSEYDEYMEGLSGTYGWVFGQIRVDPTDADRIYVMGVQLHVSEDGGKSYRRLTGMHVDHHGMWIDPANPDYIVNVNDGGVAITYDGGDNWRTFYDDLPLVQFFNVSADMDEPFHAYGSIQDHGSYRGVVDLSRGRDAIPAQEWERAPGGEGSSHAIDPTDPTRVYSAGFYGRMSRTDLDAGESERIVPEAPEGQPPYRGQWLAPFIISPHNPRVLYLGLNHVFRSMNVGESWERISPDLTYADPDKLGDIPYQTIFSISESPLEFGLIYAGTDDGRVWRTDDGGDEWVELTGDLPAGTFIAELVASRYDEATVYMVQNGKRDDDFTPYVWKSTDYGATWEDISANIPLGPANVIAEDPRNPNLLYVGTDLGVYASVSGGEDWQALPAGMPDTFVHDMVVHPRDDIAVAATHGRGMYALNVRPLQGLTPEVMAKPLHLFDPEPGRLPRRDPVGFGFTEPVHVWAHYWLADEGDVGIEVRDSDGNVVTTLEGTGDAGLNQASWDLTKPEEEGEEGDDVPSFFRRPNFVEPGTYTLAITAGDETVEATVEVGR